MSQGTGEQTAHGTAEARGQGASPAQPPFGRRLHEAVRALGPLCVGIDPHPQLLRRWGLADDVAGLERFCLTVVEALGGRVAVLKPQVAFFERFGSRGVAVLETVVAACRSAGSLTIVDAKRGDIGSTMAAYADAFARDGSPLAGDALTASPYLGFESLRPLLDTAAAGGRGVFVLALTSNPEGAGVQRAVVPGGGTVAESVLEAITVENSAALAAGEPQGSVGAVVGATVRGVTLADAFARLGGPILAPGIGAQGATQSDLAALFGGALPRVLPSSSRDILAAGPSLPALREAAGRAVDAEAAAGAH